MLCVSVSISVLFIDHGRFTVVNKESEAQSSMSRQMRKVTAGVEDHQIRTVYVPSPIHVHTRREKTVAFGLLSEL